MKYEVTYKGSKDDEEKEIIDAKFIQVLNGNLYLMSDISIDARVRAIFADWIKIVETED